MITDQMREAFEASTSFQHLSKQRDVKGDYLDPSAWLAWLAWQAAYAAGLERAAEIVNGLNDSAGDAASYDNRDMYPSEQERMQALRDGAEAIRAEIRGERDEG